MKKLFALITGVVLVSAAPLASAFPDPLSLSPTGGTFPNDVQSKSLQPRMAGAEYTLYSNVDLGADRNKGINANPNSDEFWYAANGGVSSD